MTQTLPARPYGRERTIEAVVLLNVVEERIAALWQYRSWWRQNRWADWPAERSELQRELRALVGLARKARAIATEERPKELRLQWPAEVRARSAWADAAPGELSEAWGR